MGQCKRFSCLSHGSDKSAHICKLARTFAVQSMYVDEGLDQKGYFHLCPRMDFLQTLLINNSLYTNYENVFIELDS